LNPVPIEFNGYNHYIPKNLYAALEALRHRNGSRTLWIDALCIDQSNAEEKSNQIGMMGSIYESASNVVIWLGAESSDSKLAMSTIDAFTQGSDFESLTDQQWNALENLFSRMWFSRIWVIQEFTRGRNPTFLCGNDSFNWDRTGEALHDFWVKDDGLKEKHINLLGEVGKVVSMASTRLDFPLHESLAPPAAAALFVMLLRIYGDRKAAEHHDKIYGLLGLSTSFSFHGCNPPKIDYTTSIIDVYTDWARFLISTQKSLDLLYISQRMEHDPALPSWVPDWRTPRKDLVLTHDVFGDSFEFTGQISRPAEGATGISFSDDGLRLSVEGYIITTFDRGFMFFDIEPGFIDSRLKKVDSKELLKACLMMGCKIKSAIRQPPASFAKIGIAGGRKQFRGFRGSTGLVPKDTQYGDIICMLGQSQRPFVLRPDGEHFGLIGDGYIDLSGEGSFKRQPVHQMFTIR